MENPHIEFIIGENVVHILIDNSVDRVFIWRVDRQGVPQRQPIEKTFEEFLRLLYMW